MKKVLVVILISLILLAAFFALVYFALRYSRGKPVTIEEIKKPVIEVPFINQEIDFTKGIAPEIWNNLKSQEIGLVYQLMVLPWPKTVVPSIQVKTFHNQKDIYFYLEWLDDTKDWILDINKFSDACAIMFPMDEKSQPQTLMMGFIGRANIWQWKASQDREFWQNERFEKKAYADFYYPFEEEETLSVSKDIPKSAANDLMAIRVGTITPKPAQNVSARGYFEEGKWQIVFKRSLKVVDPEVDAGFSPGKKLCAFAVWNGSKGDRGGRKSISDWVELEIK